MKKAGAMGFCTYMLYSAYGIHFRGNHVNSGGFGLEHQVVLSGEFLEQVLLGASDLLFIFLESLFDVADPVSHQAPEAFGQFASQRQIGH